MKRWLVKVDADAEGSKLYLNGVSTVQALRLFPSSAAIVVAHLFGETDGGSPLPRHVSQADLPASMQVADVIRFLIADDDLALIDFDARIEAGAALSTHDDGEATFHVPDLKEAAKLLEAATAAELSAAQRAAVLANVGRYVLISGDGISTFEDFDDVLASGVLRES